MATRAGYAIDYWTWVGYQLGVATPTISSTAVAGHCSVRGRNAKKPGCLPRSEEPELASTLRPEQLTKEAEMAIAAGP
jgi:hypothetical protein